MSREEVNRLQDLRGMYGIASPAPICADGDEGRDETSSGDSDDVTCQVLQAPSSPDDRLVSAPALPPDLAALGKDGEIRLTYGELTALIEDAVKQLR